MRIDKVDGGIDGFACISSAPGNYEGEIHGISIPPPHEMAYQMGDPLTDDWGFALRPEVGNLMRIDRISRPGAL